MGDTVIVETPVDEVVTIVTQGPQGPSGSEAATLTTTGDLLYRDALANDRLPIGSEGQVLKVSSGLPAWGNESGAVTSVNGETGTVVLDAADVGAQSFFARETIDLTSGNASLTAARAKIVDVLNFSGTTRTLTLPDANNVNGDTFVVRRASSNANVEVYGLQTSSNTLLATIPSSFSKQFTFVWISTSWTLDRVNNHTHILADITDAGTAAASATTDFAAASHTHPASDITSGTLTHERGGLEADVSAYDGLLKISGGSTSAVTLSSAGEALLDDADAAAQRATLGLGNSATLDTGTTAGTVAAGDHTHELNALDATGATDGHVLTADGAGGAAFEALPSTALNDLSNVSAAAPNDNDVLVYDTATATWVAEAPAAGGVSAIGTSAADVFSVSGSDLVADDGGTVDNADPFIKWDDTNSKLVYANPLSRPSGAFYVGLAPTTTALGTGAINIQTSRTTDTRVASNTDSIAIGNNTGASGIQGTIAVGTGAIASGNAAIAVGGSASCSGNDSAAFGNGAIASSTNTLAVGRGCRAQAFGATAIGYVIQANSVNSVCIGTSAINTTLRGQFSTLPFGVVYWGGQTTATPTILNLDATATNRFTIAANTALAVDVLLVARRSDTADKWLVARRFLGIRRDGSNNTSLIGSVQTLGTDQSDGSPTWSFTLTADDTNEALQLEVTGAASETVQWRATAFYRVV